MIRFSFAVAMVFTSFFSYHAKGGTPEPAPKIEFVNPEISDAGRFRVVLEGISPSPQYQIQPKKTDIGSVFEWTRDLDTVAAHYGASKDDGIWRLTEVRSNLDELTKKRRFLAITTSFSKNGVRSKTNCEGLVTEPIQCVTATRKFCHKFKESAGKGDEALGAIKLNFSDEKATAKIRALGLQCSNYAAFLDRTLNPNNTLESPERAERDDVIRGDISTIQAVKKNTSRGDLGKLKGLDDNWSPLEDVGVSTTGMKNRAARLRAVSSDFRALSTLATMCAETGFAAVDGAWELNSGGQTKSKPKTTTK